MRRKLCINYLQIIQVEEKKTKARPGGGTREQVWSQNHGIKTNDEEEEEEDVEEEEEEEEESTRSEVTFGQRDDEKSKIKTLIRMRR